MDYAVVTISGKQHQVVTDQELLVTKIPQPEGKTVTFDQVHLRVINSQVELGQPLVKGALVTAKVLRHLRGPKLRVAIFKAKSRYRKVRGSRQHLTLVKIMSILERSVKTSSPEAKPRGAKRLIVDREKK